MSIIEQSLQKHFVRIKRKFLISYKKLLENDNKNQSLNLSDNINDANARNYCQYFWSIVD